MVQKSNRWMETSDVIPMFPSLVWKVQIEGLRDALATNIRAALADLRRGLPPLEAGRGWQSQQALHEREDFRDLVLCVRRGVTSILRFLRIGQDAFEITASWATVLAKGAAHKVHSHPKNFLSGVYYVCTQSGADTINFHDPRRQKAVIWPPGRGADGGQHRSGGGQGAQRSAADFPSFLKHSVDATERGRKSVSAST